MDSGVSDSHDGVFPDKVYATLEIRACRRNYQCTRAGKINSIDSRVHGNRTLYAEARSYHYKLYLILVGSEFCFLAGCRGREIGGMINIYTTYYYTILQQLMLHCYLY